MSFCYLCFVVCTVWAILFSCCILLSTSVLGSLPTALLFAPSYNYIQFDLLKNRSESLWIVIFHWIRCDFSFCFTDYADIANICNIRDKMSSYFWTLTVGPLCVKVQVAHRQFLHHWSTSTVLKLKNMCKMCFEDSLLHFTLNVLTSRALRMESIRLHMIWPDTPTHTSLTHEYKISVISFFSNK